MKTIKEELQDAADLDMDKRELGRICGNALAEIKRLEAENNELRQAIGVSVVCLNAIGAMFGAEQETCH